MTIELGPRNHVKIDRQQWIDECMSCGRDECINCHGYRPKREGKRNELKKPVDQLDMEGNYIRTWPSASDAARSLGGGTQQVLIDYVDPVKTTIAILKDWRDQEWKATNGLEQVEEIETRLTSTTSHMGSTPVTGSGGNRVEAAMAEGIHQKEIAEHGFLKAREYMGEIAPCWERLTEDERYMLMVRFIDYTEGDGIKRIMNRYNIEKTEAYNKSNAALTRLSKLIFW